MKIWIDAQIAPAFAEWSSVRFGVEAVPLTALGLRDARDRQIFLAAREAGAIVLTKDSDFVDLVLRLGPPPAILWITLGNSSNQRLQRSLENAWPTIERLLRAGEPIVELKE